MAQRFLLSAAARSLSLAKVMRLSDAGVEDVFLRLRWPGTGGKPTCPRCGCAICHACRRPAGQLRWRCKACRRDFSITSATLFAWRKLPLRTDLLAVVLFCNEVKGKSMLALALARGLDVQCKTAFVLAHKLREAMAASTKGLRVGGAGQAVEIDGAYFGGHVRPENRAARRIDRRLAGNKSGKRRVVAAMRERGGRTLPQVFAAEEAAVPAIRQRIAPGTVVHADESPAWNPLHARFAVQRISHQHGYSIDRRALPGPLRAGSRLARGPAPRRQRRANAWRRRLGDAEPALGRLLRLLATRSRRLTHPPADHAIHVGAPDRAFRPGQRGQDGLLDQRAGAAVAGRRAPRRGDALGQLPRRQRLRGVAQHVVDQPAAFAGAEPRHPFPLRGRIGVPRQQVWIEQPHGRVQVRQAATMLRQLLLQAAHDPAQLKPLPARGVHDTQLGHRNPPSRNTKVQDGSRTTPLPEQRRGGRCYMIPHRCCGARRPERLAGPARRARSREHPQRQQRARQDGERDPLLPVELP